MEKILLAFSNNEDQLDIAKMFKYEFQKKGINVEISQTLSLSEIEEFLYVNKDCITLIMGELLKDGNPVKPQYFSKIKKQNPKLRIIYLIDDSYYKSSYLESIYEAKTYNCLFRSDSSIENIVYICLNPRNGTEAKSYYGFISNTDENLGVRGSLVNGSGKKHRDRSKNGNVIIREKIVYKPPRDYQKVIGIYSPYAVGKTVIASNLTKYYTKNKLEVTLIDTDYYKKDLLYYFPLDDDDFLKLSGLYNDTEMGKEIYEIDSYAIEVGSRLKLFTDHRDSQYKITIDMVNNIIRSSESNLIIIDIARQLEPELANEILALCDERIIVTDKMISTLNGLPYKLRLSKYNMKNLSLIVNRDINIKGLWKSRIEAYFRDIELTEDEKYNLEFNNVFFVPNRFELISEAMSNRDAAFGGDEEFDESIIKIGSSLYQVNMGSKERGVKGLFKIFNV